MDLLMVVQIILIGILLYLIYDNFKPVKGLQHLSEKDVKERMKKSKNITLIDVRQPNEFRASHIKGAVNIPLSQIKRKKTNIPVEREIILYCQTGIRSKQAAKVIKRRYKEIPIAHLKGGLYAWKGDTNSKK
ncbi:rhodanese-like domain-containing protein [Ferdinandcohnia quinoae]|uniref:Rhodanese-like domain-containing protein n=1 Tax=Fredinandcohnia quinoae TaxID=2918902 RepID=A0AAW5EC61_9BACI|nr:rhodanese-like domain-containing protein [Fredinandcohnia sp. SECRCQ15]MCH1627265.1 rhodanese-like domain-containing protein [Fredinandcohnia sp. SECRCQ15]